jgi:uncharacterized protein (TIGR00296 family)
MNSADLSRVTFAERDGPLLTSAARNTISEFLETGRREIQRALSSDPRFKQKMGCFVTLKEKDPEKSLRGCIGYPEPILELSMALTNASIEAATGDPRFPPVKKSELSSLLLEVSVLTKPVQIEVNNRTELPSRIDVGKDGLIIRWSYGSGLLLPQVASEYNWEAEEFLCNLCMKAGAPPDQWLVPGTAIYKFRALVFEEN